MPPVIINSPNRAPEGAEVAVLVCMNPNSADVSTGIQWFRVGGDGTVLSTSPALSINGPNLGPVTRDLAGGYECQIMSLLDSSTASTIGELIVECKRCFCVVCFVCLLLC